MSIMENTTSAQKNGGRKKRRAKSKNSYVIYDTCSKCPYAAYVDVVCNDNVQALIVSGTPSDEVLQEAKMSLISEFAQLSGNSQSSALIASISKIYLYRNQITGLGIAHYGIINGLVEDVKPFLKSVGIVTTAKDSDTVMIDNLLRKIDTKTRKIKTNLKIELGRYENISKTSGGKKITEEDFNAQHVALCAYFKFSIPQTISAAQYAAYVKQYKKAIDHASNNAK